MQTTEIGRGIVSSRVALLLRSAEIQPLSLYLFGSPPKLPPPCGAFARGRVGSRTAPSAKGRTPNTYRRLGERALATRLYMAAAYAGGWVARRLVAWVSNGCWRSRASWGCRRGAAAKVRGRAQEVQLELHARVAMYRCRATGFLDYTRDAEGASSYQHRLYSPPSAEELPKGSLHSLPLAARLQDCICRNHGFGCDTFIPSGIQAIPSELAT